jgi:hypothetical protein
MWSIILSDVTVFGILVSGYLPTVFHILQLTKTRLKINSGEEAHKAARDFTASIASAYRLSESKVTLSDGNNNLPGLDHLLKARHGLTKLWHETKDRACS